MPVEGQVGRKRAPKAKSKSKPSPKKKIAPKPKVKLVKKENKVKEKKRGTAQGVQVKEKEKKKKKNDDGDSYNKAYSRIYRRLLAAGATLEQAGSVTTMPDGPMILHHAWRPKKSNIFF